MALPELLDTLRIRLPGALDGAIRLELYNAAEELCRASNAYRETLVVALTPGQESYAIAPPERVVLILYEIEHPTLDLSGCRFADGTLTLKTAPGAEDAATPLAVVVSLVPLFGAGDPQDWLPPRFYDRFHQALTDGALARMHAQPAKPYSDARRAVYHGQRFRNAIRIAAAGAAAPHALSPQTWRFPRFGG